MPTDAEIINVQVGKWEKEIARLQELVSLANLPKSCTAVDREMFEAWHRNEYPDVDIGYGWGSYIYCAIEDRWIGWLAAKQQARGGTMKK